MSGIQRRWFLMDDIPSPYYAVSSRKIKFGFTGNVMTIRRSGDDATQTFGFVGETLDTSAIASFITAGGGTEIGYITEWYDQMNASNKMVQLTTSRQPIYNSSAINGKIGMQSTLNDVLRLSNNIDLNNSTAATMFCVCDVVGDQASGGANPFATDTSSLSDWFRPFLSGTDYFIQGRDSSNNLFSAPTISTITGKNIFIAVCDGVDNIKIFRNGASSPEVDYTDAQGFLNTLRNLTLGPFVGLATELLVFDGILNQDNRERVRDNINSYYSIY